MTGTSAKAPEKRKQNFHYFLGSLPRSFGQAVRSSALLPHMKVGGGGQITSDTSITSVASDTHITFMTPLTTTGSFGSIGSITTATSITCRNHYQCKQWNHYFSQLAPPATVRGRISAGIRVRDLVGWRLAAIHAGLVRSTMSSAVTCSAWRFTDQALVQ